MNNKAQLFILCEDATQYYFARKYFELLGFDKRNIIGKYNLGGRNKNSAEYVKNNYVKEIKAFHNRIQQTDYILVIIIDDDNKDNLKKLHEVYTPLSEEQILIFSPKRNIESWFHYIDIGDNNIEIPDEEGQMRDYRQYRKNSKPTEFAKRLKEKICANGLPKKAPSSLHHACNELKRLSL